MTSHYVSLTHGRMHYLEAGAGPAILFVHGTPTNSYEFRHLIAALSATHRCIAPDHLGFGKSDRPQNFAYTPEAHAETLREFVEALGLEDFTLVVHDFGGPIGLGLAMSEPADGRAMSEPADGRAMSEPADGPAMSEPADGPAMSEPADGPARPLASRMVIMNTWAWPIDDDPKMARGARLIGGGAGKFLYRYANASLRLIMPSAYGDKRKLTKEIHRQYLDVFRDRAARVLVLHALATALLASRAHYQSLLDRIGQLRRLPVLIVWGMKDSAFQPYQLERWQTLLPEATVVKIAGAGHWPHEEEPAQVITAIEAFMK